MSKEDNQFWKEDMPNKVGRPLIFKDPEELWEKAKEYFKDCDTRPLVSREYTESQRVHLAR